MGNHCGGDTKVIATRKPNHMNVRATKFYEKDGNEPIEDDRFIKIVEAHQKNSKDSKGMPTKFFIKTVKGRKYITKERFEAIKDEMNILCKIDHPNILKYYDLCGYHKKFHLVMDYSSGKILEYIRIDSPNDFSESKAMKIIYQLLDAVCYLNQNNLSHRNINPENILIEDGDLVKITNFEQSKVDHDEKNLQKKDGTSAFTAPELLKNEFNEKCDVWSIGVIAYKLISGEDPIRGDNLAHKLRSNGGTMTTFSQAVWSKISDDGKDLISKMCHGDPDKRISAIDAMQHKAFATLR
jgi:calcium-dependent protein kinase